ncbi:hypothetical protein ACIHFD_67040 [Nonomuraea sp. NPDC051941]|uniref:hypothetical protein n=1 Tax=Nonomuraea sp. NPDC051941 TaxID=3364373 RepID=UPI0037CC384A
MTDAQPTLGPLPATPQRPEVTRFAAIFVPHEGGGGRRGARMNAGLERPEQLSQTYNWEVIHDEER